MVEVDQMAGVVSPADTGNMLCCRKKKCTHFIYLQSWRCCNNARCVQQLSYPLSPLSHLSPLFSSSFHTAKYLDRKKNMNGAPDVVVKQYPILANGGNSAKVNPMTQHLRSEH